MHASSVAAEPAAWQEYTGQTPAGNLGKCGQPGGVLSSCKSSGSLHRTFCALSRYHALRLTTRSMVRRCYGTDESRPAERFRPAEIKRAPALAPRCPRPGFAPGMDA